MASAGPTLSLNLSDEDRAEHYDASKLLCPERDQRIGRFVVGAAFGAIVLAIATAIRGRESRPNSAT